MVRHLSDPQLESSDVITQGAPIISFGDYSKSRIATLGLNPSDKEFYDSEENELVGNDRRFHTLSSLNLTSWDQIDKVSLKKILFTCENYFYGNSYDRWFKPLNIILSGTGASYYDSFNSACHLDLVPYATRTKWGELLGDQRHALLQIGSKFLGEILNSSSIEVLILNGKSVITNLERASGTEFSMKEITSWQLRRSRGYVKGEAYIGRISELGGVSLKKQILVLGFNHNIQSSFGVTNEVKNSIKNWVTRKTKSRCS
jgi:hypothetical protein